MYRRVRSPTPPSSIPAALRRGGGAVDWGCGRAVHRTRQGPTIARQIAYPRSGSDVAGEGVMSARVHTFGGLLLVALAAACGSSSSGSTEEAKCGIEISRFKELLVVEPSVIED